MRVLSARGLVFSLALSIGAVSPNLAWAAGRDEPAAQAEETLRPDVLYLLLLGEIAGARGELAVATQAYVQAANETRDVRVVRRAAQFAMASRDLRGTLEAAKLWTQLDPKSEEAQRLLETARGGGDQQLNQIQFELARVLASNPQRLEVNLMGLNAALAGMQDKSQARTVIDRLTAPYAQEPAAFVARAQAAANVGMTSEAAKQVDLALVLRPQWEPAVMLKAEYLAKLGELPQALALLKNTLIDNPEQLGTQAVYAHLLSVAGKLSEAEAEFRALQGQRPDNVEIRLALADVLARQNRLDEARQVLDEALKLKPGEENAVWFALGEIAQRQNRLADAVRAFDRVQPGEGYFEAQLRAAVAQGDMGQVPAARARLHALVQDEEDDEDARRRALLTEVGILRVAKQYADALALLDESLRDAPDDGELLYESAMLEEFLHRYEQMETHARRLIELEPENPHGYNLLGYSLADRNERLDEAARLIEKANTLAPNDPFILDSLGWVRFRQGKLREAEQALQRAYDQRHDAEIAAHLGEVLWAQGRQEEAKTLWYSALEATPDNKVLRGTMHRLLAP